MQHTKAFKYYSELQKLSCDISETKRLIWDNLIKAAKLIKVNRNLRELKKHLVWNIWYKHKHAGKMTYRNIQ